MSIILFIVAFGTRRWTRAVSMCLLLGAAGVSLTHAQPDPIDPPVTFRTLAVGNEDIYNVFYDDQKGRPVSVCATRNSFSGHYTCPPKGLVSLYRLVPAIAPEIKPRRAPVGQAKLGKTGPWLLVMRATGPWPSPVELQIVDDSWSERPILTMRVFNFSKRHAAVQLGDTTFELASGGSHLINYPEGVRQSWIKVAMKDEDGWTLRVAGPQSFKPNTRSTLVLSDALPEMDIPGMPPASPGIIKIAMVDPAPKSNPVLPASSQKLVGP